MNARENYAITIVTLGTIAKVPNDSAAYWVWRSPFKNVPDELALAWGRMYGLRGNIAYKASFVSNVIVKGWKQTRFFNNGELSKAHAYPLGLLV